MTRFTLRLIAPGYSGVALDVARLMADYRGAQERAAAAAPRHLPVGWRIAIPTTVSAEGASSGETRELLALAAPIGPAAATPAAEAAAAGTSPVATDVQGAAEAASPRPAGAIPLAAAAPVSWTPEGGGRAAAPAAFIDFARTLDARLPTKQGLFAATATQLRARFHDFGVYVAQLDLEIEADPATPLRALRSAVERACGDEFQTYLSERAKTLCDGFAALAQSSALPLFEPRRLAEGSLGAHRLFIADAAPGDLDQRFAAMRELLNMPNEEGFKDRAGAAEARCAIGDGNSLLIHRRGVALGPADPSRAIGYYQFYYAALLQLDRRLLRELPNSVDAQSPSRSALQAHSTALRGLRRHAALFRELGEETANSMSPTDYHYWRAMCGQWRTDEIETNLNRKLEFLTARIGETASQIEARASMRAGNILLLLSSLAILSIVFDVADTLGRGALGGIELAALGGGVVLAASLVALGYRR